MPLKQQLNGKRPCVVSNYHFTGKLLGKGNFARVEEAVHNILDVKVAVKIMEINKIKEEYVIRNLCREARIMGKLNHPCICALYQTMQQSNHIYYLVTELASGGDLCSFVKEQSEGRLDEGAARIFTRQFVSALAHMHSLGVVHRDLKMENVMLNPSRTLIKIVDFGLSNLYKPDEPLKTHCGSPEYAAPELFITGRVYGPEVDVWSLGIILYGMVVGQLPFVTNRNEKTSTEERRKRLIGQINKGLSGAHKKMLALFSIDFRHVLERMLMPDSAKRITVKELIKHSFITEKGTKYIRSNPISKIETRCHKELIEEISEMTNKSQTEVKRLIKEEPYSRIGGMYNILSHKMALGLLSGDGITKIQPLREEVVEPRKHRPSTARNFDLLTSPKPAEGGHNHHHQRLIGSALTPTRPKVDSRWPPGTPCCRARAPTTKPPNPITPKASKNRPSTTTEATRKAELPKKLPFWLPSAPKNVNKDAKRFSSANNKQPQSKGIKVPEKPSTALGVLRKAPIIVHTEAKTPARPQTSVASGKESRLPVSRCLRPSTTSRTRPVDKPSLARGDDSNNQKPLKKPTIYDPIARSIAEYVCNNVPSRLTKYN